MVQWPGRRGKMVKWRTPFGKWASYAIFGTYAFIGWNLIPVAVYFLRKQHYQEEYLQGKHSRPFDQLNSTEKYFAFFGWQFDHKKKFKIDILNLTVEEYEPEGNDEPTKLLHELPAHVRAQRDFESRQGRLEDLRKSIAREAFQVQPMPYNNLVFPSNAIFE